MRDRQSLIPVDKNKIKSVKITCSTHADSLVDSLFVLKEEFEKRGTSVSIQRRLKGYDEPTEIAKEYDLRIYAGYPAVMHR